MDEPPIDDNRAASSHRKLGGARLLINTGIRRLTHPRSLATRGRAPSGHRRRPAARPPARARRGGHRADTNICCNSLAAHASLLRAQILVSLPISASRIPCFVWLGRFEVSSKAREQLRPRNDLPPCFAD